MKKTQALFMAVTILLLSISPNISYAQDSYPTENISSENFSDDSYVVLNTEYVKLTVNQQYVLVATVYPYDSGITGEFYSEDESIAVVDSQGTITPIRAGITHICYITQYGAVARCCVEAVETDLPLNLTKNEYNLVYDKKIEKGSTCTVSYCSNSRDFYNVIYTSSNPDIASVTSDGRVVPHGVGKVDINVYADGKHASCKVNITDTSNKKLSLNEIANRYALSKASCERYVYGKSANGRELEAYIIRGSKSRKDKILFLDFACHGFEDSYAKDGKVLVNIGNELVKYYSLNPNKLKKYTLVIVPCANPDGTIAGKNNLRACSKAFGRCTAKHIDMNRDFTSFKAKESKALKALFSKYNPDVYLNFHGWLDTSIGTPWLARMSSKKLSLNSVQAGSYGRGFIISYVRSKYKASVCLVEYKSPKSAKKSVGKTKKFISAIVNR